jgi:predicted chitinase
VTGASRRDARRTYRGKAARNYDPCKLHPHYPLFSTSGHNDGEQPDQLTGRANYVAYGKARNKDFVSGNNYKLLASDTNLAVDVACWYWTTHRLNELADADDLNRTTHKINRGYKGLPDRAANLKRAKFMLLR